MNRPSGRVALECTGVSKAHGGAPVVSNFSAIVNRGEKIVLVGRNGLGKTTLLKALLADAPNRDRRRPPTSTAAPCAGATRCRSATSRRITPARSRKGMTAVEWLHQFDPDASRQDIHGLLGQMLFSGEEGLKPTEALSGGETARLLFCRIMLQKPNVLVLDEPTNHLDLESINALNVALQKFEGTVLLVTHDQDLMEEVGTRVWHFDGGRDSRLQGHVRGVRRDARVRATTTKARTSPGVTRRDRILVTPRSVLCGSPVNPTHRDRTRARSCPSDSRRYKASRPGPAPRHRREYSASAGRISGVLPAKPLANTSNFPDGLPPENGTNVTL